MAGRPVPDRPTTQSNVAPWLKVPGHADVLFRSMRSGRATWAVSLRPCNFLGSLRQLRAERSAKVPGTTLG